MGASGIAQRCCVRGLVIAITGGAAGLGREFSLALARAGALLVVSDLEVTAVDAVCAQIAEEGGTAIGLTGDITEPSTSSKLAEATLARFGRIDGLVNNAGLLAALPLRRWNEISPEEWDRCQAVNLKGAFLCAQAMAAGMKARGGAIVNISSGRFFEGGMLRLHYTAAKAGVVGLTRGMARELGPHNIRVNCVAPGITVSETLSAARDDAFFEAHAAGRCLARPMYADDLIGPLMFLLSDGARFVTGQVLSVDGGKNLH